MFFLWTCQTTLQSVSHYSTFEVFWGLFLFVVSAFSFSCVFYILLWASYHLLCAINCIWKSICKNNCDKDTEYLPPERISVGRFESSWVVQVKCRSMDTCSFTSHSLLLWEWSPPGSYWILGLELWLLYSFPLDSQQPHFCISALSLGQQMSLWQS